MLLTRFCPDSDDMVLSKATKKALYRRKLTGSLNLMQTTQTTVYCDYQGTLALTKSNAKQHQRTKHINVRYHFVREQSKLGNIRICFIL